MAQIEITVDSTAGVTRLASRWKSLQPWQARRVREYVEGGLAGRLSIRNAAERARLSPNYFSRRFRQSFGVTFARFVAERRIERAQDMMRSSGSLAQIALACGFTDQAHFTRSFGRLTGSTPSEWRRTAAASPASADRRGSACRLGCLSHLRLDVRQSA